MKKIFILLIFCGCMSTQKVMDSWIGHTKQELIMKWGPPNKIVSDQNNGEIYLYSSQHYYQGIYVSGNPKPVGAYTYWEYDMFFINSSEKVYHWLVKTERVPPQEFNIDLYLHY